MSPEQSHASGPDPAQAYVVAQLRVRERDRAPGATTRRRPGVARSGVAGRRVARLLRCRRLRGQPGEVPLLDLRGRALEARELLVELVGGRLLLREARVGVVRCGLRSVERGGRLILEFLPLGLRDLGLLVQCLCRVLVDDRRPVDRDGLVADLVHRAELVQQVVGVGTHQERDREIAAAGASELRCELARLGGRLVCPLLRRIRLLGELVRLGLRRAEGGERLVVGLALDLRLALEVGGLRLQLADDALELGDHGLRRGLVLPRGLHVIPGRVVGFSRGGTRDGEHEDTRADDDKESAPVAREGLDTTAP